MDDDYDDGADTMLDELRNIGSQLKAGTLGKLGSSGMFSRVASINESAADADAADAGAADAAGETEPELPEDNFDVIGRARAAAQQRYDTLKIKHQIDLNDAKHLADLEDVGLQSHMEQARARLAEHQKQLNTIPNEAALQRADTTARRAMSSIMASLKEMHMSLQVACNDILLQSANAQKLADGDSPHGYPPSQGQANYHAACFETLSHKIEATGTDISRIIVELEAFESNLTLTRRNYETVVDGTTRRCQHFEREIELSASAMPIN